MIFVGRQKDSIISFLINSIAISALASLNSIEDGHTVSCSTLMRRYLFSEEVLLKGPAKSRKKVSHWQTIGILMAYMYF